MKIKIILTICAIICVTLVLIGILFWPTLYRYDKMILNGNTIPIRIHRLTGYTEYFFINRWMPQQDHGKRKGNKIFPSEEKKKVTGNADLDGYGSFEGKIYNGSERTITNIVLRVVAKEKDGTIRWDRRFRLSQVIFPLSTKSFDIIVTGDRDIASCEWYIEEVKGYQENMKGAKDYE